jgi:2-keto-4-pentenoate hydratase
MHVAELEFAFRMGKDLPPRAKTYSVDEVLAAVATLHPAIEIPDSRLQPFEKAGGPQLIADNACAHYFFLGEAALDSWRNIDLAAHQAAGRINDGPEQPGIGSNVLGDPRIALA